MIKTLLTSLLLFSCLFSVAQEQEFAWDSKKKIKATQSIGIDATRSFHVVSFKESKTAQYGLSIFATTEDGQARAFETVFYDRLASVLSYQLEANPEQLVLLLSLAQDGYRVLQVLAFDWETGKVTANKKVSSLQKGEVVIRNDDGILVIQKEEEQLSLVRIKAQESLDTVKIAVKHPEIMTQVFENGSQWVDQNEFVSHGSVYPSKVYIEGEKLYFVLLKNRNFKVITMNLSSPEQQSYVGFGLKYIKKYQDTYSYVFKGKLFLFYFDVNDIFIEIFDVEKGEKLHRYSLAQDFKYQINRREIAPLMNAFREPKHHLTAAINEGQNGQLVIGFDYVDVNAYEYGKDKNFEKNFKQWLNSLHQQNMMFQQQLQWHNNHIKNFRGPNAGEIPFEGYPLTKGKEKLDPVRFSVVLEADFSISKEPNTRTLFENPEVHPVVKELKANKKIKYQSAIAVGQSCRYIYFDKKNRMLKMGNVAFEEK